MLDGSFSLAGLLWLVKAWLADGRVFIPTPPALEDGLKEQEERRWGRTGGPPGIRPNCSPRPGGRSRGLRRTLNRTSSALRLSNIAQDRSAYLRRDDRHHVEVVHRDVGGGTRMSGGAGLARPLYGVSIRPL